MANFNPKVDAYIAKSAPFAKEILEHLRELVHIACPDIEETIKWGFPHFEYEGIVCSMAAFKAHCAFGFWKGAIMKDPKKVMSIVGKTAMGSFDRISSLEDLPSEKILLDYIREAVKLNVDDIKLPEKTKSRSKTIEPPDHFIRALKKNKTAQTHFNAFSNSHKKEYIEWIAEAKTDATRQKRIDTAIEWIAEGKPRNWKYMKK